MLVCMYACMYAGMYVCMHACVYIYRCIYIYIYIYMVCSNGAVMSFCLDAGGAVVSTASKCSVFKLSNALCFAVWKLRFRLGFRAVLLLLLLLAVLCSAGVARGHPLLCGLVVVFGLSGLTFPNSSEHNCCCNLGSCQSHRPLFL